MGSLCLPKFAGWVFLHMQERGNGYKQSGGDMRVLGMWVYILTDDIDCNATSTLPNKTTIAVSASFIMKTSVSLEQTPHYTKT